MGGLKQNLGQRDRSEETFAIKKKQNLKGRSGEIPIFGDHDKTPRPNNFIKVKTSSSMGKGESGNLPDHQKKNVRWLVP